MQVVLLCGGLGTRIRDVSEDVPKPMIPIGGQPILWHIMKGYAAHGFNDFVLCLGYKSAVVKKYFVEYGLQHDDLTVQLGRNGGVTVHPRQTSEDWKVTLVETGVDSMTGHRIKRVEPYITGDTFLLTYGDGVADVDVRGLVDFHRSQNRIGTVTAVRPPGRFGEIEIDGGAVTEFNEKPAVSRGWINGGFFAFDRRMFDRLDGGPTTVLEQEPLIRLARDGELAAFRHEGFWHPMDTSRDYQYLNGLWAAGKAPWKTPNWESPAAPPALKLRPAA